eukprot:scaffold291785_cov17-Tisochrysis_lutea.AAC.1
MRMHSPTVPYVGFLKSKACCTTQRLADGMCSLRSTAVGQGTSWYAKKAQRNNGETKWFCIV